MINVIKEVNDKRSCITILCRCVIKIYGCSFSKVEFCYTKRFSGAACCLSIFLSLMCNYHIFIVLTYKGHEILFGKSVVDNY
jgi:hypothetical protein